MRIFDEIKTNWQQLDAMGVAQLPKLQQLFQMAFLYIFRNIGPRYFFQGRFWRPEIKFSEKIAHGNKSDYQKFVFYWNERSYQKSSQHKVVEKAVLNLLGVPTAKFIAFLHPRTGVSADGRPMRTAMDLKGLCNTLIGSVICLKPVEGFGGAGFSAFKIDADPNDVFFVHPVNGARVSIESWWLSAATEPNGFIIEHYLHGHPELYALHPNSLNTIRIWVVQLPEHTEVVGAYLRIGQKGKLVDNVGSGGLFCPVDIENGVVGHAIDDTQPWNAMTHHPDTKAQIFELHLPFWQASKNLACRALEAFPHMRFAGVDVAVTRDGPKMIELNVWPDRIGCAWMDLPLKSLDSKMRRAYATKKTVS